jgi:hypothetical protein
MPKAPVCRHNTRLQFRYILPGVEAKVKLTRKPTWHDDAADLTKPFFLFMLGCSDALSTPDVSLELVPFSLNIFLFFTERPVDGPLPVDTSSA